MGFKEQSSLYYCTYQKRGFRRLWLTFHPPAGADQVVNKASLACVSAPMVPFLEGSVLSLHIQVIAILIGYSSLRYAGFSLQWLLLLRNTGSRRAGFSSCGTWAP